MARQLMTFDDIKTQLQTGDILLFYTRFNWKKPITYLSAAIRFFARVKYNHAAVYIKNWNVGFVNEAVGRGVISEIASHRMKNVEVKIRRLKDPYYTPGSEIAKKANSVLGYTRYDFLGTLWYQLLFQLSGKRFWLGPENKNESMKRMYCYEYAAWVHDIAYPDWWKVDLDEVIKGKQAFTVFEGKLV